MKNSQPKWPGILMALLSALCYSTLAIFIKLAFSYHLTVITIVVLRMGLASILLWLTLSLKQRERRNWHMARQDWPFFLGGVVLTFAASEFTYFMGLRLMPASVAIFLVYLYPVLVVLIAYLIYGERLTKRKIGVGLICFFGCAALAFEPNGKISFSPWGVFLILLAAAGIALYTVFSQRLLKKYSPLAISAWTLPPVGIVFAFLDWNNLPHYTAIPVGAWWAMLGAAFFGTYLGLLLYFSAIVRIGAAHTALLCTIEPVSTALLATWVLDERLTLWQMFGASLIFGGLLLLEWPAKPALGSNLNTESAAKNAAEFTP